MPIMKESELYFEPDSLKPYRTVFVRSENLRIRFNRFVPFDFTKATSERNGAVNKRMWIGRLAGLLPPSACDLVQAAQADLLEHLQADGWHVCAFSRLSAERLALGLGNEHVAETGLLLHHIYGIPYISGSGLKGITRAWVIAEYLCPSNRPAEDLNRFDRLMEADGVERMLDAKDRDGLIQASRLHPNDAGLDAGVVAKLFEPLIGNCLRMARRTFGKPDQRGGVIFFDAFPTEGKLDSDVMTPHYSYKMDKWPTDTDNPIPVTFATVSAGTQFAFRFAAQSSEILHQASVWAGEALEKSGAGAKTSVGFGRFFSFGESARGLKTSARDLPVSPSAMEAIRSGINERNAERSWPLIEEYFSSLRDRYTAPEKAAIDAAVAQRLTSFTADDLSGHRLNFLVKQVLPVYGEADRRTIAGRLVKKKLFKRPELADGEEALKNMISKRRGGEENGGGFPRGTHDRSNRTGRPRRGPGYKEMKSWEKDS